MNISTKIIKDYLIVKMEGELDHHRSEDLRKKIDQQYFNNNLVNIILDFSGLNFMDSSGIGLIMGRYKNCLDRNGEVKVVSTSSYINRMLKMSGVLKIVRVYDTIEEAMKI